MKTNFHFRALAFIFGAGLLLATAACSDDDKAPTTGAITLSEKTASATTGEEFSVTISLTNPEAFDKIVVKKTLSGQEVTSYAKTIIVAETTFPYTFKEKVLSDDYDKDVAAVVVYSFYGYNAAGTQVDATDLQITAILGQYALLTSYDWQTTSYKLPTYPGYEDFELAGDVDLDNLERFYKDKRYEMDWGEKTQSETLYAYCAWKYDGTENAITKITTIKYSMNIASSPIVYTPKIVEYEVVKITKDEMILRNIEDWSGLGGRADEVEEHKYVPVRRTAAFTYPRGAANPADYLPTDCNPSTF